MDWIGWIRGPVGTALQWFEAHPGTASWLGAIGSITAIVFVYLFALYQGRRTRSHENTDRIRRAQGLALVLIPVLTAFRSKIEAAIIQEGKPAAPDEVMHLLDQLYILGVETETPLLSVTASAAPILPQRTMCGSRWQAFPVGPRSSTAPRSRLSDGSWRRQRPPRCFLDQVDQGCALVDGAADTTWSLVVNRRGVPTPIGGLSY
jgi:hypothetical protein